MTQDQSLFDAANRTLAALEGVLRQEQPDLVIVQGDTTTIFVAALAAYYFKIPLAHVEAGLRTGDKYGPFPEEINRRMADLLADVLFSPTARARKNLLAEGVAPARVFVTGNTGIDALLMMKRHLDCSPMTEELERAFFLATGVKPNHHRIILVTAPQKGLLDPPTLARSGSDRLSWGRWLSRDSGWPSEACSGMGSALRTRMALQAPTRATPAVETLSGRRPFHLLSSFLVRDLARGGQTNRSRLPFGHERGRDFRTGIVGTAAVACRLERNTPAETI
jgi:hypothetical protein